MNFSAVADTVSTRVGHFSCATCIMGWRYLMASGDGKGKLYEDFI